MEQIIVTFTDGTKSIYDTEGWDDYKLIDTFFCVRKKERNVGIFNMEYVKSIVIQ